MSNQTRMPGKRLIPRWFFAAAIGLARLAGGGPATADDAPPKEGPPRSVYTERKGAVAPAEAAQFQQEFDRLELMFDLLKRTDEAAIVLETDKALDHLHVTPKDKDPGRFEAERALKLRLWLRLFRFHVERCEQLSQSPVKPLVAARIELEGPQAAAERKRQEQQAQLSRALHNPAVPMHMAAHVRDCFTREEAAEVQRIVKEELVTPKLIIKFRDALDNYDWSIRNPYSITR